MDVTKVKAEHTDAFSPYDIYITIEDEADQEDMLRLIEQVASLGEGRVEKELYETVLEPIKKEILHGEFFKS